MNKLLLLFTIVFVSNLQAQDANKTKPKNMEAYYRQFDFWIGDWEVYQYGTEKLAGHNKIESIVGGKALQETYHTPNLKYEGTSLNKFNPLTKKWEQFWVDNSGLTLHLEGGLVDGKMVLISKDKTDTGFLENKITWEALEDGSVRQTWVTKTEKDKTWQTAFDGIYKKAKKKD